MSYMYYSLVGTMSTIIVAVLVSYFTKTDDDYDENLLHPMVLKVREYFTCQPSHVESRKSRPSSMNEIETGSRVNPAYKRDENGSCEEIATEASTQAKPTKSSLDLNTAVANT